MSPECESIFKQLKSLLTNAPLLVFPDFEKEFILETDASGSGLGAVLAQEQEGGGKAPIAYASHTLQKHKKKYGVTELEALGVVWAVKHFRPYLYGCKCRVITDHEALKSLLNMPRWGLAIQELDLQIQYRPGKKNQNVDALSCLPTLGVTAKDGEGVVNTLVCEDAGQELGAIKHYLKTGKLPSDEQAAREPVLPTTEMLEPTQERTNLDVDDYIREISLRMSSAWKTAQAKIKEAQKKQKYQHDKKARDPRVFEGDRVFVYSPAKWSGKAYKFAHPFKGPYRVLKLLPNGALLSLVAEPNGPTIRVALNRLR